MLFRSPDNATANRSGLKLKYRGQTIAQVQTPVWNSASYIPVVMTLTQNGVVTVNVDGTNALTSIATSYLPARGRFGFYARTGGANETHWIDDLNINLPDSGYVTLTGTNLAYSPPRNGCGTDTFYYQVSDGQGGLVWDSTTVQLLDLTPPIILVGATNRLVFAGASCSVPLTDLTLTANSGLIVTDSCSLTITQSPLAGSLIGLGTTMVTIYAVDAGTNITTTTSFVTNRDITLPTISCVNTTLTAVAAQCYALSSSLLTPINSDNCTVAVVSNNAPAQLAVGTTFVTWSVIDGSGNSNGCVQTVVVLDTQLPSITCPANIVTNLAPGVCPIALAIGVPLVSDNCGVATLTSNAPAVFPFGVTTVTWTVTDVNGNVNTCRSCRAS